MDHDDPTGIGTALRDRVRDEDPDLDRLIRVSTSTGTRMRRRRTAAAGLGCVLAGAAVAGILGSTLGGSDSATGREPSSQPTSAPDTGGAAQVSVDAPGWRCDPSGEQAITCVKDDQKVVVAWRPGSGRPDPRRSFVVHQSDPRYGDPGGRLAVTFTPVSGTSEAAVNEISSHLHITY